MTKSETRTNAAFGNFFVVRISLFLVSLVVLGAGAAEKWNNPLEKKIAGVAHGAFHSASMNVQVGFNVYLPSAYKDQSTKRFPVIYYLHGVKGNESSYLDYARCLDKAVAGGTVPPMILVFANGGATSFFTDAADGSVMGETVVVRELIPHIDTHYRTVVSASGRAVHGFSMGGFGALKLAFKYSEMFGAVVSYDALLSDAKRFRKEEEKLFLKLFGNESGFASNDPVELLRKNAAEIKSESIQIVVTDDEREILEGSRNLHRALNQLRIKHDFRELTGVAHKKEAIYEKAALGAFQFTARAFAQPTAATVKVR